MIKAIRLILLDSGRWHWVAEAIVYDDDDIEHGVLIVSNETFDNHVLAEADARLWHSRALYSHGAQRVWAQPTPDGVDIHYY